MKLSPHYSNRNTRQIGAAAAVVGLTARSHKSSLYLAKLSLSSGGKICNVHQPHTHTPTVSHMQGVPIPQGVGFHDTGIMVRDMIY